MRGLDRVELDGSGSGDAPGSNSTGWEGIADLRSLVVTEGQVDSRNLVPDSLDPRQEIADKLRGLGYEINSEHWDKLTGGTLHNLVWNLTGMQIGEEDVKLIDDWRRSHPNQERHYD